MILFLMMFIASSNKGNVVSTNHLLLFPVSNERQVPVLCINMSSDLHRPSRHSGWRNATFRFTWQGCSYFFFFFLSLAGRRTPDNSTRLFIIFFFNWCFSCAQAVPRIRVQTQGGAELFQTSNTSLVNLSSPEMNCDVEIHFCHWIVKIQT